MTENNSTKGIILIVDDTPDNLGLLMDMLGNEGFEVRLAINGEEAIEQVEYSPPDIILMDVMMPGMNGYQTCHHLKKNKKTREIPIIFLTALEDTPNKVKGFKAGGVDYMTKPLQLDEVRARVTTHLAIHNLQSKLKGVNNELKKRVADTSARILTTERFLENEIEEVFVGTLSEKERSWLIEAIAGMILSDGTVQEEEIKYLRKIMTLLSDRNEASRLADFIKQKKLPEIQILGKKNRQKSFEMLLILAKIAIVDGKLVDQEASFLIHAGGQLGFDKLYCKEVLNWAKAQMALDLDQKRLRQIAEHVEESWDISINT